MEKDLICPHCGRVNDTHEKPGRQLQDPQPGDVGICWKCHGLAILTPFGFLRPPTEEELAELECDDAIRRSRAAMSEAYTPSQAIELLLGEDQ